MPTASEGAPPVRENIVCSPTIVVRCCISAGDTGYPQDDMVAVATIGFVHTIPAGLLMAKYIPGCRTQAAMIAMIPTNDSISMEPYPMSRA
jgi:hypothetical protein